MPPTLPARVRAPPPTPALRSGPACRSRGGSARSPRSGAAATRPHGRPLRCRVMLIRVGFSADPDDAFMFWGLASGAVDPQGFQFEPVIEDIQTLNEWALEGRLEVTAISLATYPLVQERYALLPHGASIGYGYGPIVVAKERLTLDELRETEIVIPGTLTTGFLVLKLALGDGFPYRVLPFDEIQAEVA